MMRPEDVVPVQAVAELPGISGWERLLATSRCCFWLFAYAYGVKGGMDGRPYG